MVLSIILEDVLNKYQNEYKRERVILALLFVVLMIMVGGIYVVSHAHELFVISAQAIEYPREVLASFIKGVAHR